MTPFRFARGRVPLLISLPHAASFIPDEIACRMTEAGRAATDTDWHVDQLWDFSRSLGANLLIATHARYVVDLNRDPAGARLYPELEASALCPLVTFAGEPLYRRGMEPDAAEIEARIASYWRPYHETIASVLARLVETHGIALLIDAHSVASRLPRLFEGTIPEISLGTREGTSCDPALAVEALALAEGSGYSAALDQRFKGGFITQQYGMPALLRHALQIELSRAAYLEEAAAPSWSAERAQPLIDKALRPITEALLDWALLRQTA